MNMNNNTGDIKQKNIRPVPFRIGKFGEHKIEKPSGDTKQCPIDSTTTSSIKNSSRLLEVKKMCWLESPIRNVNEFGFTKFDKPGNLSNKSLRYLNSNKYQIDDLFNKLVMKNKNDNLCYQIYNYDPKVGHETTSNTKLLFNEHMLKSFVSFCYDNSEHR